MDLHLLKRYFFNCFILMMPPLVWNLTLAGKLPGVFQPEIFQYNIPLAIAWGESISRFVLFGLAMLTMFSLDSKRQRWGMGIYIAGTLLYFASWLWLMYLPQSIWSNSVAGFMAPALTPSLWLLGIGLVGERFYFNLPYRKWIFPVVALVFLVFHNLHTYLVYYRTHV